MYKLVTKALTGVLSIGHRNAGFGQVCCTRFYQKIAGVPDIRFNDGQEIPQIGFGTWKTEPEKAAEAVKCAIDVGYRHIDCAYVYDNEKQIGEGIKSKIDDGTVKREDLFITGKLWNSFHRKEMVPKGLQATLDDLGLDYLDLYLIHWPHAFKAGYERPNKNRQGKINFDLEASYLETWKAMEDLVDSGRVKAIGFSNLKRQQFQDVLDNARIQPAVLQVENNPHMRQDKLMAMAAENNVRVIAHTCIGSFDIPWRKPEDPYLLTDPKILNVAAKVGRTPAQVVLRWNIQRGVCVIPKSVTPSRIMSNFQLFDFVLSDEEMAELNSFEDNYFRTCDQPWLQEGNPNYPFNDPK